MRCFVMFVTAVCILHFLSSTTQRFQYPLDRVLRYPLFEQLRSRAGVQPGCKKSVQYRQAESWSDLT